MIKITFLYFVLDYIIYFFLLVYFNYCLSRLIKFFIIYFWGYNILFYISSHIHESSPNTYYDTITNHFVIDYEYFDLIETVWFHEKFYYLNTTWTHYFYYMYDTRDREDDDHELFRLLSQYQFSDAIKYYIVENYVPARSSHFFTIDFYDIDDLMYEFSFFYKEYNKLLEEYIKNESHLGTILYNKNLFETNILQNFYYDIKDDFYYKRSLKYLSFEDFRRPFNSKRTGLFEEHSSIFLTKKDEPPFDILEEPSNELCKSEYVNWFILKKKYDEFKFDYDIFMSLPLYERFYPKYYDIYSFNNLFDPRLHFSQTEEHIDEYFLSYFNRFNQNLYYFEAFMFFKNDEESYDFSYFKDEERSWDFVFFKHNNMGFTLFLLLLIVSCIIFMGFLLVVSWYCLLHSTYMLDFNLHFSYLKFFMYTRHADYQTFNKLIVDMSYKPTFSYIEFREQCPYMFERKLRFETSDIIMHIKPDTSYKHLDFFF